MGWTLGALATPVVPLLQEAKCVFITHKRYIFYSF